MISTACSRASSPSGFNYVSQEGNAQELTRSGLCGDTPQELDAEFKGYAEGTRLQNNQLNILISPDVNQSDFSDSELLDITEKHLQNLGLENNPHIAYVHRNTDHPHVHILVSRADAQKHVCKDSYIGQRAKQSINAICKDLGLENARESVRELRQSLSRNIQIQARESVSLEQLNRRLSNKDIRVEAVYKTNGKNIQGYRVHAGARSFKLSEVNRGLSQNLTSQLSRNAETVNQAISRTISHGGNDKALEMLSKHIGHGISKGANLVSDVTKAVSMASNPVSLCSSIVQATAVKVVVRGMDWGMER